MTLPLKSLYEDPERIVVTAHRGFSGEYPENTLLAFTKAIELDVDIIEFDIRGTGDDVPIILHDETVDRTTNGTGSPRDFTLKELQQLNASLWKGAHNTGKRLSDPAYSDVAIPTFEEFLQEAHGKVGLNIQLYDTVEPLLTKICHLFHSYDLYNSGYLTVSTFQEVHKIRAINPQIEICVLEDQWKLKPADLKRHLDLGLTFIQPGCQSTTPELCRAIKENNLCANMFFSNTDEDNRKYIEMGLRGILSDYPNILIQTIRDLETTP
jgi:glycerophosphoryl diester phosphodiesterase